jgi:hypothetical protein
MTYDEVEAIFDTIFDRHKGCSTYRSANRRVIYFDRLGTSTVERDGKRIHVPDNQRWAKYSFADVARYVCKTGHQDSGNVYYELIPEEAVVPTCDQVSKAVERYETENPPDEDRALRSALGEVWSLSPSFGRFLAEVCLIADWGTFQTSGPRNAIPFLDRVDLAKRIETYWQVVLQPIQNSPPGGWDTETTMLSGAVDQLSQTNLLVPTPGTKKSQLSFVSKYLHWCVNGGFPIWDTYARKALTFNSGGWRLGEI